MAAAVAVSAVSSPISVVQAQTTGNIIESEIKENKMLKKWCF